MVWLVVLRVRRAGFLQHLLPLLLARLNSLFPFLSSHFAVLLFSSLFPNIWWIWKCHPSYQHTHYLSLLCARTRTQSLPHTRKHTGGLSRAIYVSYFPRLHASWRTQMKEVRHNCRHTLVALRFMWLHERNMPHIRRSHGTLKQGAISHTQTQRRRVLAATPFMWLYNWLLSRLRMSHRNKRVISYTQSQRRSSRVFSCDCSNNKTL